MIDYVVQHLRVGRNEEGDVAANATRARSIAVEKRIYLTLAPLANLLAHLRQQQLVQLRRERLESLRDRIQPLRELSREAPESMRAQLRSSDPEVRLAAVHLIALHRARLEADLIELLNDKDRAIRREAHQSLVRLARGTDFGPQSNSNQPERLQAIRRWQQWLALQDRPEDAPVAQARQAAALEKEPARAEAKAGGTVVALRSTGAQVARLVKELVDAPADQQGQLLEKLKETEGALPTLALAAAIPRLKPAMQAKARDALAERLARLTTATLRDKLADDDPEIRRAVAVACALRNSREHIAELLVLLDDSEPVVADVAHAALKRLTKQDFGPKADATDSDRLQAIAAWHAWWKKQDTKVSQAR